MMAVAFWRSVDLTGNQADLVGLDTAARFGAVLI